MIREWPDSSGHGFSLTQINDNRMPRVKSYSIDKRTLIFGNGQFLSLGNLDLNLSEMTIVILFQANSSKLRKNQYPIIGSSTRFQGDQQNFSLINNSRTVFHKYTEVGESKFVVLESTSADYLIVAGGGGGGGRHAGGGGGGGVIVGSGVQMPVGEYNVKIGAGGVGGSVGSRGSNGKDSAFWLETAIGGGGGGAYLSSAGGNGGSGGGSGWGKAEAGTSVSNTLVYGKHYGNKGGKDDSSSSCSYQSGGGGGAAVPGEAASYGKGGKGGDGIQWIDGMYYGGGGGGAVYQNGKAGDGGLGGGGGGNAFIPGEQCSNGGTPGKGSNGGTDGVIESRNGNSFRAGNGGPNTGGGGGGASQYEVPCYGNGGNGGSGIVSIAQNVSTELALIIDEDNKIKSIEGDSEIMIGLNSNSWVLCTLTRNGTKGQFYMDGKLINSYINNDSNSIYSLFTGDLDSFEGEIAEILIYNKSLESSDRYLVEDYLREKWSILLKPSATYRNLPHRIHILLFVLCMLI